MPQVRIVLNNPGQTWFAVPADFPTTGGALTIECLGSGNGGGGAYTRTVINDDPEGVRLQPQTLFAVQVGLNGTDTWISNTGTAPSSPSTGCLAKGGGATNGGSAASCVPNTVGVAFSGGNKGADGAPGSQGEGGYGGAAGPWGNGGNGGNYNAATGGGGGGVGGISGPSAAAGGNGLSGNGSTIGGVGGNNSSGVGGGSPGAAGSNGGGGGGGSELYSGGNASQLIVPDWQDYAGNNYGIGSGPGGSGFDGSERTSSGTSAGYGGGKGTSFLSNSTGLIVLTYSTGTTNSTTFTEILAPTTISGNTWRIPYGVQGTIKVEIIGAGGNGVVSSVSQSYNGGGGGAYTAADALSIVDPATTFNRSNVPAYLNFSSATDTWFNPNSNVAPANSTLGVLAKKGGNGSDSTSTPAPGGQAANCIPSSGAFSGGNGGSANISSTLPKGGGGGGAAGPSGIGKVGGNGRSSTGPGGGGGGGGSNGGSSTDGANSTSSLGGDGGVSSGGNAGGAGGTSNTTSGAAGNNGSGGGGGYGTSSGSSPPPNTNGLRGGNGGQQGIYSFTPNAVLLPTFGPGGGGGGAGTGTFIGGNTYSNIAGNGGGHGGGGGGAGGTTTGTGVPGSGAPGLIVLTYTVAYTDTPSAAVGTLVGPGSVITGAATRAAFASGALVGSGSTAAGLGFSVASAAGGGTKERIFVKSFTRKFAS